MTEIARTLNRSVPTIATQKRSATRKLHVENHVDLVKYAAKTGLAKWRVSSLRRRTSLCRCCGCWKTISSGSGASSRLSSVS
ncbi:hypothetical protein PQR51_08380 [Caballeronia grimmiae]